MNNSLSRKKDYRKMLIRNAVTSLILYENIKTTLAKAKVIKAKIDHLLAIAKKNDLPSRRNLLAYLLDKKAVKKVYEILIPRYKNIKSGFTLIYRINPRLGDSAPMAILKLKEGEIAKLNNIKEKNGSKETVVNKPKNKDKLPLKSCKNK